MANVAAIQSVSASLERCLNRAYADAAFPAGVTKPACKFAQATTGSIDAKNMITGGNQVLFFLYRVGVDARRGNAPRRAPGEIMHPAPIAVELHYLFSFWATSAENEQLLLAWTLRQLHANPVLDQAILSGEAGWSHDELVQLVPEEITTEEIMRVWDALETPYRLSLSYIARPVHIETA